MIGYVVLQKGFEYNDEVYSESDSGGGHPRKIYFNKQTALAEVKRLNINEFKNTDISLYSYEIEDICENTEELLDFCKSLKEKYGEIPCENNFDSPDEYRLHPNANEEESEKYMDMVYISFYELSEADFDEQDIRDSKLSILV
jgi:hypothetical protein